MTKTSSAMKALKTAAAAVPEDTSALNDELHGASDRACVIMVGTAVDDALYVYLKSRMRKLTSDGLSAIFEGRAPLSSFSARIDVGWGFKFIGDAVKRDLHRLREMRNACAHSKQPLFFSDELGPVARQLELVGKLGVPDRDQWEEPKDRFVIVSFQLIRALIGASEGDAFFEGLLYQ